MAIAAHVEELSAKHQRLEQDIALELQRPNTNQTRLSELKRRKLKLKDEISRLKSGISR